MDAGVISNLVGLCTIFSPTRIVLYYKHTDAKGERTSTSQWLITNNVGFVSVPFL